MNTLIQIQWTCGSLDEARKVSRYLVQEKLVACANIIPWVESTYLWNEKLCIEQETKVIFKSVKSNFDGVKKIILENCKYEVPEISSCEIHQVNEEYGQWIKDTCVGAVTS